MVITIDDTSPGASEGRNVYLEQRVGRVLGTAANRLTDFGLRLRVEGVEGDGSKFEVQMTWTRNDREKGSVCSQRRTLPLALAAAFDAAATRLRVPAVVPSGKTS